MRNLGAVAAAVAHGDFDRLGNEGDGIHALSDFVAGNLARQCLNRRLGNGVGRHVIERETALGERDRDAIGGADDRLHYWMSTETAPRVAGYAKGIRRQPDVDSLHLRRLDEMLAAQP